MATKRNKASTVGRDGATFADERVREAMGEVVQQTKGILDGSTVWISAGPVIWEPAPTWLSAGPSTNPQIWALIGLIVVAVLLVLLYLLWAQIRRTVQSTIPTSRTGGTEERRWSDIRILSRHQAPQGRVSQARPEAPIIRILSVTPPPPVRLRASAPKSGSKGAVQRHQVPSHALCTWCGRSVLENFETRGGAVRCGQCSYLSHTRCFEEAGHRCGGLCQM